MEVHLFICGKLQKKGVNTMIKTFFYCPHCEQLRDNNDKPPPAIKKRLEEGVDTWIAIKPCLECSKGK